MGPCASGHTTGTNSEPTPQCRGVGDTTTTMVVNGSDVGSIAGEGPGEAQAEPEPEPAMQDTKEPVLLKVMRSGNLGASS